MHFLFLIKQAMEDKKMRSYVVIPPLILDAKQKRYVFHNENGAVTDMEADFKVCTRIFNSNNFTNKLTQSH